MPTSPAPIRSRIGLSLVALLAAAVAASAHAQAITVQLDTKGETSLRRDSSFELVVLPLPKLNEGRLAMVLGAVDVTDLFRATATGFAYRPELLPLPLGDSELLVYLVTAQSGWRELAHFPLQVLQSGGFESVTMTPRIDLNLKGQLDEGHDATSFAPARSSFQDLSVQLDFQGSLGRSGWTFEPRANVIGVTNKPEALRFGQEGEGAPKADLSNYSVKLGRGAGFALLGGVQVGDNRLLAQQFGSRGLHLRLPLGARVDANLAAASGTQIVGFDDLTGLERSEHRLLTGTLGFELLQRPGGLRLETSYLDGSLQPLSSFNQGSVTDAEESSGYGLRLLAATPSQRLRFEGGWARSEFENPADPFLFQGADVVAVEPETRAARYAELNAGLLQKTLGSGGALSFDFALRHSRVDPQYRTIAVFLQADREENTAELRSQIGALSAQLTHSRASDNLDDIVSILTTKTRRTSANFALPIGQLVKREEIRPWLPALTYTIDRTHQFGVGVPEQGSFNLSFIPDQVSLNELASFDWSFPRIRVGLRLGESDQDNRQVGRETADLGVRTAGLTLGGSPHPNLDLTLEASRELSDNRELAQENETVRYAGSCNWRLTPFWTLTGTASQTDSEDNPLTRTSSSWNGDVQVAWRFEKKRGERHGLNGQLFLRYLEQSNEGRELLFDSVNDSSNWNLTSGLTLSLF